ncbi:MAG: hypothetical protein HOP12_15455 [Candidatus Eisenbacteria bacterium]|uniref:Uncharacterized protein n=1 Tax=Eiseniibacteriota bacterium TaxID=2212470 RepID=A0A849SM73_UNCEI|nr:hypothetical protein [Candidatus Eisenbacteria bacterium]
MVWATGVIWESSDAVEDAARRIRKDFTPSAALVPVRATVPACGCAGQCHCATLVPALLHRQIELECEFYRDIH